MTVDDALILRDEARPQILRQPNKVRQDTAAQVAETAEHLLDPGGVTE